jgi:hypothetical protein
VQAVIIGVNRLLIFAVEARGVANQEPQLRIVGSGLGGALRVIERERVIAALEGLLRGAGKPCVLNVRSKAQRLII